MKKTFLFVLIIFSFFTMVACDITDKSLQSLDTNYIPNKVTKDFELPRGKYRNLIWTSNNEKVLKIEENNVTVIQLDVDVLVTVTAKVNNKSKDFEIIVLKKNSGLSPFEKAMEFMSLYGKLNVNQEGLYITKKIDNLYLTFDDKLIGGNARPTYTDDGDAIVIEYLETDFREINVYFSEMIDGELVVIHKNKIKINYIHQEDLFFQLRPFDTYLNDSYLVISTNEELEQYINSLSNNEYVDDNFIQYLERFRNRNLVNYNISLVLINYFQPTSDNEVVLTDLTLDDNNLIVNIDTIQGINDAEKVWPFVIEVNENLRAVEDVIINTNYVSKEKLYLKNYVYNHSYFDDFENKITVIETLNELEDYIDYIDLFVDNYGPTNSLDIYKINLLKYDEQYFQNKKLIIINYYAGSGSFEFLFKDYKIINNKLEIRLKSNNPYIGTDDIRPWNFIFEANKLLEFDEVSLKITRNNIDLKPIIRKPLETITFADDSYNFDNVYMPVGNLSEHKESLETKYNIDFNDEVIIINDKEAFKEIYSILKGEDYEDQENLEGYVWLLVERYASGSQFIGIEYNVYDWQIGYIYPRDKEAGDTAIFNCLDIIKISLDDYNKLYNLNFVNMTK